MISKGVVAQGERKQINTRIHRYTETGQISDFTHFE